MRRDVTCIALLPVPGLRYGSYLHRLLAPRLVGEVCGIRIYVDPLMPPNTWELRPGVPGTGEGAEGGTVTRDEAMNLSGRELDAAVAERVMGRSVVWREWREELRPTDRYSGAIITRYSTDNTTIWQVVERMHELGWRYVMLKGFQQGNHRHYAAFDRQEWYDANPPWSAWAGTLPEAICRAALLAVAETVKGGE